jgi:hypothetical protein
MADKKINKVSHENTSSSNTEVDELNLFIEKKRIQNEALKKIVDKLNSPEEHKNKK